MRPHCSALLLVLFVSCSSFGNGAVIFKYLFSGSGGESSQKQQLDTASPQPYRAVDVSERNVPFSEDEDVLLFAQNSGVINAETSANSEPLETTNNSNNKKEGHEQDLPSTTADTLNELSPELMQLFIGNGKEDSAMAPPTVQRNVRTGPTLLEQDIDPLLLLSDKEESHHELAIFKLLSHVDLDQLSADVADVIDATGLLNVLAFMKLLSGDYEIPFKFLHEMHDPIFDFGDNGRQQDKSAVGGGEKDFDEAAVVVVGGGGASANPASECTMPNESNINADANANTDPHSDSDNYEEYDEYEDSDDYDGYNENGNGNSNNNNSESKSASETDTADSGLKVTVPSTIDEDFAVVDHVVE